MITVAVKIIVTIYCHIQSAALKGVTIRWRETYMDKLVPKITCTIAVRCKVVQRRNEDRQWPSRTIRRGEGIS